MSETSRTVRLGELFENDYNPRQDLGDVESLAADMEQEGLIQSPTVRPVDDGYEVIAGSRRLAALRIAFDDDHPVEVVVRDVDDRTARRLAFKENKKRKDLTPMEEAEWYGNELQWCDVCEKAVTINHTEESMHETMPYVSMVSESPIVGIPGKDHSAVKELADELGDSPSYIRDRLSFLTLPEDVHPLIDAVDLTKRAARMLARIDIDDADARATAIRDIVDDLPESMSDDDYDGLKADIQNAAENWNRKKGMVEEDIENYADLVEERKGELTQAIEAAASEFDREVQLSGDVDELLAEADQLAEALDDARAEASNQRDAVAERRAGAEREAMRATQALKAHEGEGECPYCGSDVTIEYLKERVAELEQSARSAESAVSDLAERESALRNHRTTIVTASRSLSDAIESYQDARDQAKQFAGVSQGAD